MSTHFVAWINGKPDHRVADGAKMPRGRREAPVALLTWNGRAH